MSFMILTKSRIVTSLLAVLEMDPSHNRTLTTHINVILWKKMKKISKIQY